MARIDKKSGKTHVLTDEEAAYLHLLNKARIDSALIHHTNMSGFMSHVAKNRLGYSSVETLQFEYDPDNEKNEIIITEITD